MSEELLRAEIFLKPADRDRVKAAIERAEGQSSGEIRVHLDDLIADDPLDHAAYVFNELGMHKTRDKNGVLFYVSVVDRKLAVIGDTGINERTGEGFWGDVLSVVQEHFSRGENAEGLVKGIEMAGEKLSAFFPYRDDDRNELSDEISIG